MWELEGLGGNACLEVVEGQEPQDEMSGWVGVESGGEAGWDKDGQ